jgi:hypothetical protein
MRILMSALTVTAFLSLSAIPGQAYGLKPGYSAHAQLVFAGGWERYDAGCLKWMPFVKSWYNTCGAWAARPRGPVVVAKY